MTPEPIHPVEPSTALQALDEFTSAFVLSGTKAEFNRTAHMILPFVNSIAYEFLLPACDCGDLEVWYVRAEERGGYFYSICHEHRLQSLGRAVRCPRLARGDDGSGHKTHRRRKSGYTTARWYQQRGM